MPIPFPHKIWADPDHLATYHEAVDRVKASNPGVEIPSHLDQRGLDHVLGELEKLVLPKEEKDEAE